MPGDLEAAQKWGGPRGIESRPYCKLSLYFSSAFPDYISMYARYLHNSYKYKDSHRWSPQETEPKGGVGAEESASACHLPLFQNAVP